MATVGNETARALGSHQAEFGALVLLALTLYENLRTHEATRLGPLPRLRAHCAPRLLSTRPRAYYAHERTTPTSNSLTSAPRTTFPRTIHHGRPAHPHHPHLSRLHRSPPPTNVDLLPLSHTAPSLPLHGTPPPRPTPLSLSPPPLQHVRFLRPNNALPPHRRTRHGALL